MSKRDKMLDRYAAAVIGSGAVRETVKPAPPKIVASASPSEPKAGQRWDKGASGPANQDGLREEPATDIDPETGKETPNPNNVRRRRRDDWVIRYFRGGKLNAAQAAAAAKLRMASEGRRERDPLAAIGDVRHTGDDDPLARYVDNRRLFRELWARIPQSSRPVVERVVLQDQPIWRTGPATRERHMQRLRDGLDAIC